jgi:ABC-2 type transport system permease protein
MSPKKTIVTSLRVLAQLRHDHRTVALIILVPSILMILLRYVFDDRLFVFNDIAPTILGIFPLITMFLVTSIATLRERTSGTLDRLMTMPISKADFIFGYAFAFLIFAFIQAIVATFVLTVLLSVPVINGVIPLFIGALFTAFLGIAMGLFTSAFAKSEFQAVQFMPTFLLPQLLTCGLFAPREAMAVPLQWLSDVLPLTYSVDAMRQITMFSGWTSDLTKDLFIIGIYGVVALCLGAFTVRRQD